MSLYKGDYKNLIAQLDLDAKLKLYAVVRAIANEDKTEAEIDLGFELCLDPEVQEHIQKGADKKRIQCPWDDYAGNPIFAGDIIKHPSGQWGTVIFHKDRQTLHEQWRVVYFGDEVEYSLGLQIGDRGQAVVQRQPGQL